MAIRRVRLCGFAALIVLVHLRVLADPCKADAGLVVCHGFPVALVPVADPGGRRITPRLARVMASLGFPPGSLPSASASWAPVCVGAMVLGARLRSFRRLEELRAENETRLLGDVDEARRVAESLRQSEESHRLLFEKSPLPMWLVERGTLQFLAVNDAAVRHYGYSRDEFLEMTLPDSPALSVPMLLAYSRAFCGAGLPIPKDTGRRMAPSSTRDAPTT